MVGNKSFILIENIILSKNVLHSDNLVYDVNTKNWPCCKVHIREFSEVQHMSVDVNIYNQFLTTILIVYIVVKNIYNQQYS